MTDGEFLIHWEKIARDRHNRVVMSRGDILRMQTLAQSNYLLTIRKVPHSEPHPAYYVCRFDILDHVRWAEDRLAARVANALERSL